MDIKNVKIAAQMGLTTTQGRVLELVAEGLPYKEVGARLHVTEKAVKWHIQLMLRKLGLKHKCALMAYVYARGWRVQGHFVGASVPGGLPVGVHHG